MPSTNDVARMLASLASSASTLSRSASAAFGLTRRHLSCAFSPWPLTRSKTTTSLPRDQLDAVRVEGAELEEVLAAVVVGALLQVVDQRAFDGDDRRLRRVAGVDRRVRRLAADEQRGARAAGVEVDRRFRLVEAVLLQVRRRRLIRRDRLHLHRLHAADQPFDGSEVGPRLERLPDLPVRAVLRQHERLAAGDRLRRRRPCRGRTSARSCRAGRTCTC